MMKASSVGGQVIVEGFTQGSVNQHSSSRKKVNVGQPSTALNLISLEKDENMISSGNSNFVVSVMDIRDDCVCLCISTMECLEFAFLFSYGHIMFRMFHLPFFFFFLPELWDVVMYF